MYLVHSAVQQEIQKREEEKRQEDLEKFCVGKTYYDHQVEQCQDIMRWANGDGYYQAKKRLEKLEEEKHQEILKGFQKEKREDKLLDRFKNRTTHHKRLEEMIEIEERNCLPPLPNVSNGI